MAITKAIDVYIKNGVLEDILTKQRNEVFSMILSTFDKELYEKDLKEEAYEKGAYNKLCELITRKLKKGKTAEQIADELEEEIDVVRAIMNEMGNMR